jgi:hypothetical protein
MSSREKPWQTQKNLATIMPFFGHPAPIGLAWRWVYGSDYDDSEASHGLRLNPRRRGGISKRF